MSSSLRHVLISLAIVVLAVLAHGRLLQAGFLGHDLRLVDSAYAEARDVSGSSRPAPQLVRDTIARTLADEPVDSHTRAATLRVTAFVVLLLGALAAGFAIRRALLPWVGGDTARAAGFACALFVAVHPFSGAALARPRALGELMAWLFGALAAYLFLRGRQMRERRWVAAAGIAAIVCGFCSPSAWLLPFGLAALELGSARRPRPMVERLRTALTTFAIFAACVFVESAVAAAGGMIRLAPLSHSLPDLSAWSSPGTALASCVEKLGLLFFPVTGGALSTSWPSYLVCIAIALIALWPLLRSARVAPRLWGSLATAWIAAMLLAVVPLAGVRVAPDDGSRADALMIAAAFASAGLAAATTSLLGTRRIVLPALIAIGSSWLSARAASHYVSATDSVARLKSGIVDAQHAVGEAGRVLVVDPPQRVAGLDLGLTSSLDVLCDPNMPDLPPLAISADSIPLLTRTIEFARWRSHRVAFLEHEGPFTEGSVPARMRVVSPTAGTKPPLPWRGESRSPFVLDLDPATVRFVRVTALPGTSTAEAPRLAWRASEPAGEWTVANGVWVAGENGPVALFDPWSDPEWWTAPTIRRVSAEDPLVHVALFELLTELKLECSPRAIEYPSEETAEWIFRIPESSLPQPVRGRAVYVLEIFDPTSTGYQRIDCAETTADGVLTLRARVARTPFEGGCNAEGASWSLERRVGGVAIARTTSDDAR